MFPPGLPRLNVKKGNNFPGPRRDTEHTDSGWEGPGYAAWADVQRQLSTLAVAPEGVATALRPVANL